MFIATRVGKVIFKYLVVIAKVEKNLFSVFLISATIQDGGTRTKRDGKHLYYD